MLTVCASDKWVLNTGGNNCSGYTIWTAPSGATGGNTSATKMCIKVQAFKAAGFTATARYTGGCISGGNIVTVNTKVDNLNTFATAATTLYTGQRTALSTANGAKYESEALLTKFFSRIADYNVLKSDYSTYTNYINAFTKKATG